MKLETRLGIETDLEALVHGYEGYPLEILRLRLARYEKAERALLEFDNDWHGGEAAPRVQLKALIEKAIDRNRLDTWSEPLDAPRDCGTWQLGRGVRGKTEALDAELDELWLSEARIVVDQIADACDRVTEAFGDISLRLLSAAYSTVEKFCNAEVHS